VKLSLWNLVDKIPNTRRQTIDKGYHPTMISRIEAPIIPFNVFFLKKIH